jgi:hypothetical protein
MTHWMPMYYNWFILEGFLNRFSTHGTFSFFFLFRLFGAFVLVVSDYQPSKKVKWVYFLYFGAFVGVIGVAVNIEGCPLNSFTVADVPYPCGDFSIFICVGRACVLIAWLLAALGTQVAKPYCFWRVLAAGLPLCFYFASIFVQTSWLAMPILWCVAIGLDVVLHFIPSTTMWRSEYIPRHTHYAEERHAMLYVLALGECVIAAGVPVRDALPFGRTVVERYGAMLAISLLSFMLAFSAFIATDTAKLEHAGGAHALHVSRFSRCVYLTCQFLTVTAMVIAGAICKNITKYLELVTFFRYWFGFSIALILLVTAISQVVHVYPPGDTRTCSRPVRLIIRVSCAAIVFGLSFIPVGTMNEPAWITIIAFVVTVFTFVEWIGRNKTGVRGHGHGHGGGGHGHGGHGHDAHSDDHESDPHHVPLLDHDHGAHHDSHGAHGAHEKKAHKAKH